MFGRKCNQIRVIRVKNVKRDVEEVVEEENNMSYMGSSKRTKTKTINKVDFTIVLFTQNGVLSTREFNGDWNLDDIRNWEN